MGAVTCTRDWKARNFVKIKDLASPHPFIEIHYHLVPMKAYEQNYIKIGEPPAQGHSH
jgi:hypothetical protein